MGFSGGGGGVLTNHTHDTGVTNDGGALAANATMFGLSAGSILYSDGSNIQELGVGSATNSLVVNAGATAPEWAASASAGAYTFLQKETLGADTDSWTVTLDTPYQVATNGSLVIQLETLCTNGVGASQLEFTYNNFANKYFIVWINQFGATQTTGLDNSQTAIPLITNVPDGHKINAQLQFFNNPLTENTNYTRNINFSAYDPPYSEWRFGTSHREDTTPFTTEITEINFSFDNGDLAQDSIINIYVVTN